jgi:hypothetical protein
MQENTKNAPYHSEQNGKTPCAKKPSSRKIAQAPMKSPPLERLSRHKAASQLTREPNKIESITPSTDNTILQESPGQAAVQTPKKKEPHSYTRRLKFRMDIGRPPKQHPPMTKLDKLIVAQKEQNRSRTGFTRVPPTGTVGAKKQHLVRPNLARNQAQITAPFIEHIVGHSIRQSRSNPIAKLYGAKHNHWLRHGPSRRLMLNRAPDFSFSEVILHGFLILA